MAAEVENAHRTGKRNENGRPQHIIAKLYGRPLRKRLLQIAKTSDKMAMLKVSGLLKILRIMILKHARRHFLLCRKPSRKERKLILQKENFM